MEAAGLIAAFVAQGAGLADVATIQEPDARQRDPLVNQALNEALEDDVWRSLLSERERHLLQRFQAHAATLREISLRFNRNSLKRQYFVSTSTHR
jgi:hypothetical protein